MSKYLAPDYEPALHGPVEHGWRAVPVPYAERYGHGVMRRIGDSVRIISHKQPEMMNWRWWGDVMSGLMDVHPWMRSIDIVFSGDPERKLLGGLVRHK